MALSRTARRAAGSLGLLAAFAAGVLALAHAVPLPARLAEASSVVVEYRDGSPAHVFLAPDGRWRVRTELSRLDPAYVPALLALEDARFPHHVGEDPLAVGCTVSPCRVR